MTFIYLKTAVRDRIDDSIVVTVEKIINTDNISCVTRDGNHLIIEFNDTSELIIDYENQVSVSSKELWRYLYEQCENLCLTINLYPPNREEEQKQSDRV